MMKCSLFSFFHNVYLLQLFQKLAVNEPSEMPAKDVSFAVIILGNEKAVAYGTAIRWVVIHLN